MTIVFLNGEFMPMADAKISPMDRGFLFGDGIYEVIPSYAGRCIGLLPHLQRMKLGLQAIGMPLPMDINALKTIVERLIRDNGKGNLGIYIHVSRGADIKRSHAYPVNVAQTVFAFTFEIPPEPVADKSLVKGYKVISAQDLRWKRCQVKSTSLLGNVLHFQQGQDAGCHETLLFNQEGYLTEASACNVFVIKNNCILTPPLDHQLLPGITRHLLLDMLKQDNKLHIAERAIHIDEVRCADEIWLTSSSKEVAPVIELDGKPVGDGKVGDIWLAAQRLFSQQKYQY
ncbi:D-amino acid aminotransferase [Paraglaciecola sp.]|uniref:D-amino acid aminotransferase n=1 Tax=Paraglaciecola sp. TaxID=1920173 RepID=UPI0030F37EDE